MPSRAELTQYQKRFLELYSQGGRERLCVCQGRTEAEILTFSVTVSATHKETKQFFTLYNTLDDKKVYLEKEVSERSIAVSNGRTLNAVVLSAGESAQLDPRQLPAVSRNMR